MNTCIINGKIILEDKIVESNLYIKDGLIKKIDSTVPDDGYDVIDAHHNYVSPGFIEMHSHGRGGCDTMDATLESLQTICSETVKTGVTSYLPTTMTMSIEDTAKAINNVYENKDKINDCRILGVHMEGPFFSKKYKGAQPEEYMIAPTIEHFKQLTNNHIDIISKVSLAPELEGIEELIQYLNEQEILVSAGHTSATYEDVMKGVDLGVRSATHTYNAMTPLTHRAPGVVGATMDSDKIYAELILDGLHVTYAAARVLMKAKGYDKITLVSDSLEAAGLEPGQYSLAGQPVWVVDGACRLESGTLAGSITSMNKEVYNAVHYCNVPLVDAVKMASTNCARALKLNDVGIIEVGKKADIVIFNEDIDIKNVLIEGKKVI